MDRLQQALLLAPSVVDLLIDEIIYEYTFQQQEREHDDAADGG